MALYSSSASSLGGTSEEPAHTGEQMYNKMGQCLSSQNSSQDDWSNLDEMEQAVWNQMAKYYRPYDHD